MKYKEFLEYLENNLDEYNTFLQKALNYQAEKNLNRPAKKRWDEDKLQRASNEMWKKAMEPLYSNLKKEIKSDVESEWMAYIVNNEILESTNDGIREFSFEE